MMLNDNLSLRKNIHRIITAILLIILLGGAGYTILEGWPLLDSVYMTVITLTTVGFMEVQPLSAAGRVFTIFLIISGFSTIIYGLGSITTFIADGSMAEIIRRRKMDKKIKKLENHSIICGAGDMGRHVIQEFISTRNRFVLIEKDEEKVKDLCQKHGTIMCVIGNAASDQALKEAGIEKASGLITTFASDKENLFVVLTARNINPSLRIVSRSIEDESGHKLRTAGADSVVSANRIGGMRIASEMLRPRVVSFLDVMLRASDAVLRVEEAEVTAGSHAEEKTLSESGIQDRDGAVIIAVLEKETGIYRYNPEADYLLKPGDVIIAIGKYEQILKLRKHTG